MSKNVLTVIVHEHSVEYYRLAFSNRNGMLVSDKQLLYARKQTCAFVLMKN